MLLILTLLKPFDTVPHKHLVYWGGGEFMYMDKELASEPSSKVVVNDSTTERFSCQWGPPGSCPVANAV